MKYLHPPTIAAFAIASLPFIITLAIIIVLLSQLIISNDCNYTIGTHSCTALTTDANILIRNAYREITGVVSKFLVECKKTFGTCVNAKLAALAVLFVKS